MYTNLDWHVGLYTFVIMTHWGWHLGAKIFRRWLVINGVS